MILTDAGPLVAMIDRGEQHHHACLSCFAQLTGPLLTTWPAFSEAMYLLGVAGGWRAQVVLWRMVEQGELELAAPERWLRARILMEKYQDLPMDLADATLVALAEERGLRDIFTLDHADFRVYRIHGLHFFRLWPTQL